MQNRQFALYVTATPEQVWHALTDPGRNRALYYGLSLGSDWKPDSPLEIVAGGRVVATGRVLHAEPGRRLVHSFITALDSGEPDSWLSWEIEPAEPGLCRVSLAHDDLERLPDPEQDEAVLRLLSALKTECERGAERPSRAASDTAVSERGS